MVLYCNVQRDLLLQTHWRVDSAMRVHNRVVLHLLLLQVCSGDATADRIRSWIANNYGGDLHLEV